MNAKSLVLIVGFLAACSPAPTGADRDAETAERMALANSIRTATVGDWKAATTLQRMAAADAMTISLLMNRGVSRPANAQIDPLSSELRACLDEAVQAPGFDDQPLPDFATMCLIGMGVPSPR